MVSLIHSHLGSLFDVIVVGGVAVGFSAVQRLPVDGKAALLVEASRPEGSAFTQDLGG
jgi:hypothetical protein